MLQVAVHGVAGRMGRSIVKVLLNDPEAELVSAMDRADADVLGCDIGQVIGQSAIGVQVTSDIEEFLSHVEVVIDFSLPEASSKLLQLCAGQQIPLIIGTTGFDEHAQDSLRRAAEIVPIVHDPNYSQGVSVLCYLASRATELLGPDFDAEIFEIHHKHKVDSPSGTAVRLVDVVAETKGWSPAKVAQHGRSGAVGARPKEEVGVMALRGGDVVGEHTVLFIGEGERLELTHRAMDRSIFARGAVRAAHWVVNRSAGLYAMSDVMGFAH